MVSTLHLVYPPVSSYEADMLKKDPAVEALLRKSSLYAMAMRPEVTFDDEHADISEYVARVPLVCKRQDGSIITDVATIDLAQISRQRLGSVPEVLTVELGPKLLRVWSGTEDDIDNGNLKDPVAWFTTEKLLHDYSRGIYGVTGISQHRALATYDLLYVGIAKSSDTFERLFERAHHARQKILSTEWPYREGSRVTDELILFPFRVEPTTFRTLGHGDVLGDTSESSWETYRRRVVADAEKAFVHLLDPKYNIEKFANYPRSADGLWGGEHQRYGYMVAENLSFLTARGEFRGSWNARRSMVDDSAHMILVADESVSIFEGNSGRNS